MTNLSKITTLRQLSSSLRSNPELLEQMKTDPNTVLDQLSPNQIPDTRVYRIVVISLGAAIIIALVGAILITFYEKSGSEIPDILIATASAAVGALAGLLAPQPSQE
ncbi:MAG: hypothetical protein AAF478_09100 [Pseudomonadota bacterium]